MTGSFITRTSVTVPNCPKYSLNLSGVVCHDSPPTNSFPGEPSLLLDPPLDPPLPIFEVDPGVDRPSQLASPIEPFWLPPAQLTNNMREIEQVKYYEYLIEYQGYEMVSENISN